jgi:hypothetical protein
LKEESKVAEDKERLVGVYGAEYDEEDDSEPVEDKADLAGSLAAKSTS